MELNKYPCVGVMSGSSLDGLDIALVNFVFAGNQYQSFEIIAFETLPFPPDLQHLLKNIRSFSALEFIETDVSLGNFIASQINSLLRKYQHFKPILIGNHGHTAFHQPTKGFSSQIGCNFTIAQKTGIKTIGNFRSKLVAMGYDGAPLAPLADAFLYPNFLACVNIGGIANISYSFNFQGFDICPANQLLNFLANKLNFPFDDQGKLAASGKVNSILVPNLHELNQSFKGQSISNEQIAASFLPVLDKYNELEALASCVEFIAASIVSAINKSGKESGSILFSGGGAFNSFLMNRVKELAPAYECIVLENNIIEGKEAVIFAFLGLATDLNIPLKFSSSEKDFIQKIGLIYEP